MVTVFEELGLSYEPVYLEFAQMKEPEFTKYNPNGRIPAIIDHKNNDFVLWYVKVCTRRCLLSRLCHSHRESNAIIQYLVDKYDPEYKISVPEGPEKYQQLQWLYFQASGQGPYFGQLVWFMRYHQEQIPSAVERYAKEVRRVFGVLESVLSKQEWLVGNKFTVADITFIP